MRYSITVILLCLLPLISSGQDYTTYQKTWHEIDNHIQQEDYAIVVNKLDRIYRNYSFIYARHCFKALQICCVIADSIRANKWLTKTFVQGVPLWMIRANKLSQKSLYYQNTQHTLQQYNSLRAQYYSNINKDLAHTIDSLLVIDQRITSKVNNGFILSRAWHDVFHWKKNNAVSFTVIDNIMSQYSYPGERLIGLPNELQDSTQAYKYFTKYGPETIKDHRAYTMLIHYFSDQRPAIDDKLYNNVLNGYLPAYQYGGLQDFRSEYGKANNYYNVWHTAKDKYYKIEDVNTRRVTIGLNSYTQQQANKKLRLQRLKENTSDSTILLEF